MKALLRLGYLLCLLWVSGGVVNAGAFPALVVKEIELRHIGPPAVSDDLIRAHIRTKEGDPYTDAATNSDLKALTATGYFWNVQVAAEVEGLDVTLVFILTGMPVLTEISFEGNKKLSDKKLKKKLTSKVGEPLNQYKLFTAAKEMQKLYQKKGYQKTTVEPRITTNESLGRGSVTFVVEEAPKVRVVDVQFMGAEAFKQKRLRRVLKTRRWWIFSWLTGSGKLKDEVFAEDKRRLVEFYQDSGYIDFEIRSLEYVEEKPGRMIIQFHVFEGKQYRVGKVTFEGNELFPEAEIREGVVVLGRRIRPVMLEGAVFSPRGLDSDRQAIQDFYGSKGYIGEGSAQGIPVQSVKQPNVEQGTMDLEYRLVEGRKSYIEKVSIQGNTKTRDKVIRRELVVTPGEVFDLVRVRISEERLRGLGFFEQTPNGVQTSVEPSEDVPTRKDVVISVKEGQSGSFFLGAGFSSIESIYGYIGMTQNNFDLFNFPAFSGAGQKLRLQLTIGTQQQLVDIGFTEPWFLGRKLRLSVDLYHRNIQYLSDVYDQVETGGRVGLMKPLWREYLRGGISYTLENISVDFEDNATRANVVVNPGPGRARDFTIVQPRVSPELASMEGSWLVSKVGFTLSYDRRGPGRLPSRGYIMSFRPIVGGGPFGGDTDFYKLEFDTGWYFPGFAKGHILELIGNVGVLEAYGNSDQTFIWDRFYLGGAYTLRGYRFRDVGPKDSLGEPIGGNTYWMASAEYSIPLFIPQLRFAVFYDAGVVNARSYDFGTRNFADDVGAGLRITIPQMGPIRLDYGIPISHGSDTGDSPQFQFSVGWNRPI